MSTYTSHILDQRPVAPTRSSIASRAAEQLNKAKTCKSHTKQPCFGNSIVQPSKGCREGLPTQQAILSFLKLSFSSVLLKMHRMDETQREPGIPATRVQYRMWKFRLGSHARKWETLGQLARMCQNHQTRCLRKWRSNCAPSAENAEAIVRSSYIANNGKQKLHKKSRRFETRILNDIKWTTCKDTQKGDWNGNTKQELWESHKGIRRADLWAIWNESSGEADASASERCASAGLSQCVPGRAASS